MTRKFLCCFPLRLGNLIFGYIVIIISIAVFVYNFLELSLNIVSRDEHSQFNVTSFKDYDRFKHLGGWDFLFGESQDTLTMHFIIAYYSLYIIIGFLLFLFGSLFTYGVYKANHCLVSTFFAYSCFHLFFTLALILFEIMSSGWIQLGLILLSDLLLIICLFSVRHLMEAIRTGYMYSRPGEVYKRY